MSPSCYDIAVRWGMLFVVAVGAPMACASFGGGATPGDTPPSDDAGDATTPDAPVESSVDASAPRKPEVLCRFSSNLETEEMIVVDENVMWLGQGGTPGGSGLLACDKRKGGAVKNLFAYGFPKGLSSDADYVYVAEDPNVDRWRRTTLTRERLTTNVLGPIAVRASSSSLWFMRSTNGGSLSRMPKDGGSLDTVHQGGGGYRLLATDARVFVGQPGSLTAFDPANPSEVLYASGQGDPKTMAADGAFLYWLDYGAKAIRRCPLAGPCATPLELVAAGSLGAAPRYFALDGPSMIIATEEATIITCPTDRCALDHTTLLAGEDVLAPPVLDTDGSLYWIAREGKVSDAAPSYRVTALRR